MRHKLSCSTCNRPVVVDGDSVFCGPCGHRAPMDAAILSISVAAETRGLTFIRGSVAISKDRNLEFETVSSAKNARAARRRNIAS